MKQYYIQSYTDELNTKVIAIPIFDDNYVYLFTDDTQKTLIVDPGSAQPVIDVIRQLNLNPTHVFITHSHHDHIGGVADIQSKYPDIRKIDYYSVKDSVKSSEEIEINDRVFDVFKTPGHLSDHICFFERKNKILFCGDVLFRFGCGRIFDGTMKELYKSLQKLKALPVDADVYCTHEYTKSNLAFCLQNQLIDPSAFSAEEKQKIDSVPSLPVKLKTELKYNPFLKASSLEEFTKLRTERNAFRYQKY